MDWIDGVQIVFALLAGGGIVGAGARKSLRTAATLIIEAANGNLSPEDAKRRARDLGKFSKWLGQKLSGAKLFLLLVPVLALLMTVGCATSESGSLQSAPISYSEGSESEDYIHLTVHVLFRSVPEKGAISRFSDHLGRLLNDLNVVSAVTALGSQPERMLSRLEDGTRAHVSIPLRVPIVAGRDTSISVSTGEIREAAKKALHQAEVKTPVEGIYLQSVTVNVESTIADEVQAD